MLKANAAALAHQYLHFMTVNLGLNLDVTVDYYVASYTVSSLSKEGLAALPNGDWWYLGRGPHDQFQDPLGKP